MVFGLCPRGVCSLFRMTFCDLLLVVSEVCFQNNYKKGFSMCRTYFAHCNALSPFTELTNFLQPGEFSSTSRVQKTAFSFLSLSLHIGLTACVQNGNNKAQVDSTNSPFSYLRRVSPHGAHYFTFLRYDAISDSESFD